MTDTQELRLLIRQALQQVLAEGGIQAKPPSPGTSPVDPAVVEPVDLGSDQAIHQFVCRILDMSADPGTARRLREGSIRFTGGRSASSGSSSSTQAGQRGPSERIDSGAVTEAHVRRLDEGITTLVLGHRAVLTPLGRERARMRGIVIVKECK